MSPRLFIGNKAYSSWSMRPWMVMTHFGLPFEEMVIPLDQPTTQVDILRHSPTGKVPALAVDGLVIWESLAIMEYLADAPPRGPAIWPTDRTARAIARAISCEMHARVRRVAEGLSDEHAPGGPAHRGQRRRAGRRRAHRGAMGGDPAGYGQGGPFLCGAFSAADAMFAPVVNRLHVYDLARKPESRAYMDAVMALPAWTAWRRAPRPSRGSSTNTRRSEPAWPARDPLRRGLQAVKAPGHAAASPETLRRRRVDRRPAGWVAPRLAEMARNGETPEQRHTTRMVPKRVDELLDGGSLYWVIKGQIAVRQALLAVRPFTDHDGIGRCHLVLDPVMVPLDPRPHRPFQGWRYLRPDDAPPDFGIGAGRCRSHAGDVAARTARAGPALGEAQRRPQLVGCGASCCALRPRSCAFRRAGPAVANRNQSPPSSGRSGRGRRSMPSIESARRAPAPAPASTGRGRLIFALDATMSRQPTWDLAVKLQSQMFETTETLGGLDVQLVYFRGCHECRASRFVSGGAGLGKVMSRIVVEGGNTQIGRVLTHARDEARRARVGALVFVGDCAGGAHRSALRDRGRTGAARRQGLHVPGGRATAAAARGFQEIARLTGGAYAAFDARCARAPRRPAVRRGRLCGGRPPRARSPLATAARRRWPKTCFPNFANRAIVSHAVSHRRIAAALARLDRAEDLRARQPGRGGAADAAAAAASLAFAVALFMLAARADRYRARAGGLGWWLVSGRRPNLRGLRAQFGRRRGPGACRGSARP